VEVQVELGGHVIHGWLSLTLPSLKLLEFGGTSFELPFVFFILSLEDRASHSKFDDFLKLRKVREQNHTKSGASRPPELEVKRFQGCFAVAQDGFKGLRRYGRRPGRRVTQKHGLNQALFHLKDFVSRFPQFCVAT